MKRITRPEEIEPGKYYFCKPKNDVFDPTIFQAYEMGKDSTKYLGDRIWATKDNPQAFNRYIIVGPVEFPEFNEFMAEED